jgi:bis(5'-nucleosyl)-tetraphosphatase (symmetrical)
MVHAGLLPQWTIEGATECAREVESELRDEGRSAAFFERMYGNEPRRWRDDLGATERQRLTVNALTRMRAIEGDGALDFSFKGELDDMPDGLTPWFRASTPRSEELRVVFGHWSAIGYYAEGGIHALDSGCVWGRELTALCLEDEEVVQVPRLSSTDEAT